MLPFEAIPDDTVPVTAFLKVTKSNHLKKSGLKVLNSK
jgi:hypothetical protein